MRATVLVMLTLLAAGRACHAQVCQPGYPLAPAVPIYRGPTAPAVVQVHHMKDSKGQDWTHQDPAFLARWIKERDAAFKAAEAAEASKKAENFGLNLDGIQAQAKGTLDTNDREFGERVMNPPPQHEEVPIPDPPAPETAVDHKLTLVLIGCALLLFISAARGKK